MNFKEIDHHDIDDNGKRLQSSLMYKILCSYQFAYNYDNFYSVHYFSNGSLKCNQLFLFQFHRICKHLYPKACSCNTHFINVDIYIKNNIVIFLCAGRYIICISQNFTKLKCTKVVFIVFFIQVHLSEYIYIRDLGEI